MHACVRTKYRFFRNTEKIFEITLWHFDTTRYGSKISVLTSQHNDSKRFISNYNIGDALKIALAIKYENIQCRK